MNRIKKNTASLFSVVLITLMMTSCDNNLSRSNAEKIIKASGEFPTEESYDIWGYPFQYGKGDFRKEYDVLAKKGLLKITPKDYYTISLTESGKKHALTEANYLSVVKIGQREFGEITGIKMDEKTMTAIVEYRLKRINLTPFGECAEAEPKIFEKHCQPLDRQIQMTYFDDGWRIDK
jgi:hypothetical protein